MERVAFFHSLCSLFWILWIFNLGPCGDDRGDRCEKTIAPPRTPQKDRPANLKLHRVWTSVIQYQQG